jgi:hypothetical protein
VEVRPVVVVWAGLVSASSWLALANVGCGGLLSLACYLDTHRILKLFVGLKNRRSFAQVGLVAHLITSNHLGGEQCQLPRG